MTFAFFFFFFNLCLSFIFFFLSCSAWYNFLDRLTLKRYDTWNILTDTPNDIEWFSIYSIIVSYATLTTIQVSSTIETTLGELINKDCQIRYVSNPFFTHVVLNLRFWKNNWNLNSIKFRLNKKKKKSSNVILLYIERKKRRFIYTITDPCIVYIQLYSFKFYPGYKR